MAYESILQRKNSHIGHDAIFESIPTFPHGIQGIYISKGARVGRNCVIFQHVTIGSNTLVDSKNLGAPTIGDNCYIGAGAKIIGKIKIENHCRIGANAVIVKDLPDNCVAVAQNARIISKKDAFDNKFYSIDILRKMGRL